MCNQKPVTTTRTFITHKVKDKAIDAYLDRPEVTVSGASREGLRLLIAQEEGRKTFEDEALDLLRQIASALAGGVTVEKEEVAPPDDYNDPFLDSSL